MTKHTIAILSLFLFSCLTPEKENKTIRVDAVNATKPKTETYVTNDPNWATYKDTVNIGFVVTFKYPKKLYAEHFENAECIGEKIKMVDDGPKTTMDCCISMDDTSEGNIMPIDTLIQYELQKLKFKTTPIKDTIEIANVKGIRVHYIDKLKNSKIVKQSIFFTKYDTFFEVANVRFSETDFNTFVKSLKIEK